MEAKCVGRFLLRLVGPAEAEKIRRDDAQTRSDEGRHHLAIEIRPGGLAVQAERDGCVTHAFVEMCMRKPPGLS
jgi:hypothetical protein